MDRDKVIIDTSFVYVFLCYDAITRLSEYRMVVAIYMYLFLLSLIYSTRIKTNYK